MWLAFAKRPLLFSELSEALAIRPGSRALNSRLRPSQKRIVDCCKVLAIVDEKSSVIRLVHYFVQEYLQYENSVFDNGERTVAEKCITYLFFEPFALGPCQDEVGILDLVFNNVFVKYAARHWGDHVRAADSEEVDRIALNFFEPKPRADVLIRFFNNPKLQGGVLRYERSVVLQWIAHCRSI